MVVATGFFDGVHLGHRLVIEQLVKAAAERGDESMVITFWPHPRNVLQKDARSLRLLTSLDEKKTMLEQLGVSHIEVLNFTKEFSAMTMREYLGMIKEKYGVSAILLGYDNRMGSDACTVDDVASGAETLGIEVLRADMLAVDCGGIAVSSTKIRKCLEDGDAARAASMLGYAYSLHGVVVAGNRLGRTMGFPTANMQLYEPLKLVPGNGVYFVRVEVLGQERYGMCNIGLRPTVTFGGARTIETNIFGFDEDIYGLDIRLSFISKIRDEVRFGSLDELRAQLGNDRDECMRLLTNI